MPFEAVHSFDAGDGVLFYFGFRGDVPDDPVVPGSHGSVRIIYYQDEALGFAGCSFDVEGRVHVFTVAGVFYGGWLIVLEGWTRYYKLVHSIPQHTLRGRGIKKFVWARGERISAKYKAFEVFGVCFDEKTA